MVVEESQLKVAWNKAGKVYVEVSLLGSGRWRDHPSCGLQTRRSPGNSQTLSFPSIATSVLQFWHWCTSIFTSQYLDKRCSVCKTFSNRQFDNQRFFKSPVNDDLSVLIPSGENVSCDVRHISFLYHFDIKIGELHSPHITAGAAASQTRLQSPTQTPSNYPPNLTKSQTRAGHHTDLIR